MRPPRRTAFIPGLHLNEDIYAGMNAVLRGGRIKHCEYYQCGKGREEEAIEGQLGTEIVVLSGQHLFAHTSTNLGGEVENSPWFPFEQHVHHAFCANVHGRPDQPRRPEA
jgi:hypothetical protein